jgi:hypothetical protein
VYISKTDFADAFMRVWQEAATIPVLGALLPAFPGEEPLIAFPMILPMGWIDSPQYLCSVMETIADLANQRIRSMDLSATLHRLDELADTPPAPITLAASQNPLLRIPPTSDISRAPLQKPINFVDVFMDDFILLSQLPVFDRLRVRRTLFECIDLTIRPLQDTDNPKRKEPNSVKKLLQGKTCWTTEKNLPRLAHQH